MGRPKAQFCKHGHDTSLCGRDKSNACNECKKAWALENKEYYSNYHIEHRDEHLEKQKDYHNENKEILVVKQKEWRDTHKEQKVETDHFYYINNREKCLAKMKIWAQDNRDITRALKIKSQTNRNLRVPKWADWDKIKEVYANCPKSMEVDHIIPLQGKLVSGLHVSWNLQYLTPVANRAKSNK